MTKMIFATIAFSLILVIGAQSDEQPLCQTDSAYADFNRLGLGFDLLCQPVYPETIELERGESFNVIVSLEAFRSFSGNDMVQFRLHFAIDRGRLEIRQVGSIATQELSDSGGNLKDLEIRTDADVLEVEIANAGFRTAIFDIAVRP